MVNTEATSTRTRSRSRRRIDLAPRQLPPDAEEQESFLRRHFPDVIWTAKRLEHDCYFLDRTWLTAGFFYPAYRRDRELLRLKRIEDLLNALWTEIIHMPSMTVGRRDNVQMRLATLIHDLVGVAPIEFAGGKDSTVFPLKQGSLDARRLELASSFSLHPTQRDLPAKAQLVDHARDLWKMRRRRRPPRSPSPGSPFFEMVADLIVLARQDWGVENTLRAWRTLNPS